MYNLGTLELRVESTGKGEGIVYSGYRGRGLYCYIHKRVAEARELGDLRIFSTKIALSVVKR